jgi:hypothetical protein
MPKNKPKLINKINNIISDDVETIELITFDKLIDKLIDKLNT